MDELTSKSENFQIFVPMHHTLKQPFYNVKWKGRKGSKHEPCQIMLWIAILITFCQQIYHEY